MEKQVERKVKKCATFCAVNSFDSFNFDLPVIRKAPEDLNSRIFKSELKRSIRHPGHKKSYVVKGVRMSNPTADVVLEARTLEIKDLKSHVSYLQNQLRELQLENKTLLEIETRHEKEMRKYNRGFADIPKLLQSHKHEVKALEATVSMLRTQIKNNQKELKMKSHVIMKKEQNVQKLNSQFEQMEKQIVDLANENKDLNLLTQKLKEEREKFSGIIEPQSENTPKHNENQSKMALKECLRLENEMAPHEDHGLKASLEAQARVVKDDAPPMTEISSSPHLTTDSSQIEGENPSEGSTLSEEIVHKPDWDPDTAIGREACETPDFKVLQVQTEEHIKKLVDMPSNSVEVWAVDQFTLGRIQGTENFPKTSYQYFSGSLTQTPASVVKQRSRESPPVIEARESPPMIEARKSSQSVKWFDGAINGEFNNNLLPPLSLKKVYKSRRALTGFHSKPKESQLKLL